MMKNLKHHWTRVVVTLLLAIPLPFAELWGTAWAGTVYDVNGEEVFSGSGAINDTVPYHVKSAVSSCRRPTDFTASEIGSHSVVLSWTENGEATQWVIEYFSENDEQSTTITVNTNSYTLSGLTPETMYAAQVTPVCDVDKPSEVIFWTTTIAAPAPTDLSVTPYPTKADVSWNGFADGYDIEWASYTPSGDAATLQYDNGNMVANVGSSESSTWTWGVMYPAEMLTCNTLTKIAFYETQTNGSVTVNVYSGGDTAPGTLIGTRIIAAKGVQDINEALIDPITFDPTQNLWITLTTEASYCLTMSDADGGSNSRWFLYEDSWIDFGTVYPNGAAYSFMIRGTIDNIVTLDWNSATGITSPHTIEGLTPEADYLVRVKGDFGVEGYSDWTSTFFTTLAADVVPVNLQTTDITTTSATLSWADYQDSYNVKYREAAKTTDTFFFDDFENGLDQWTITADEGATHPSDGIWYTYDPTDDLGFESHSGTYCASSWSWNNNMAYQAKNWLITPQVTFGHTLKFWVRTNPGYPDSYEVLLSTEGNATTDFTVTLQALAPVPNNRQWNEVTIDLSAYAGQTGYIAIHHVDDDMNYLLIDDFGIYDMVEAGDWISASANDATLTLTGLTPGTEYEWQVQGNYTDGTTNWSEMATFTTNEPLVLPDDDDNSLVIRAYDFMLQDVTLGRTIQTGYWNTFSAPFDIDDATVTAKGMTVKKLDTATLEGGTLTLNFATVESIEAGKPYMVKVAETLVSPTFEGVTVINEVNPTEIPGVISFIPTVLGQTVVDGDKESILFLAANNKLKHPSTLPANMKGFRAYFQLDDNSAAHEFHINLGDGDGEATGIISIEANGADSEAIYTLDGRRVNQPKQKGVYIKNGKIVILK